MTITGPSINKGRSKQDYGTPWPFIRAVEECFGKLQCDLACTRENAKADRGYYCPEQDSLMAKWADDYPVENLWCNPPFDDIGAWAAKCVYETRFKRAGCIFLLTPASIGTEWFARSVFHNARVFALRPRLTFEGTADPYPKDLMLSVFGRSDRGLALWKWNQPTDTSGTGETK